MKKTVFVKGTNISGLWIGLIVALLAASSFVRIPLYPIPITMQMFIVFLVPIVFGPKISFYGVALYILFGIAGLPIFSSGGGFGYILMPSFGFIVGYLLSTIPSGMLATRASSVKGLFVATIIGFIIIYTCGIIGLYININYLQKKEMMFIKEMRPSVKNNSP